ncbi:MAG: hypothetical protein WCH44_18315, partial [Betaproteobacteria bacterium]
MKLLWDSFWRALAYGLHPRVMLLSALPLLVIATLCSGLGYFFWEGAIDAVRSGLESSTLLLTLAGWFASLGLGA